MRIIAVSSAADRSESETSRRLSRPPHQLDRITELPCSGPRERRKGDMISGGGGGGGSDERSAGAIRAFHPCLDDDDE